MGGENEKKKKVNVISEIPWEDNGELEQSSLDNGPPPRWIRLKENRRRFEINFFRFISRSGFYTTFFLEQNEKLAIFLLFRKTLNSFRVIINQFNSKNEYNL